MWISEWNAGVKVVNGLCTVGLQYCTKIPYHKYTVCITVSEVHLLVH